MTKKINGGTIGLDDRQSRYNRAKGLLSGGVAAPAVVKEQAKPAAAAAAPAKAKVAQRTLTRGMKGDDVKRMQQALGLTADGDFGFGTAGALKKWQRENGLEADGVAGPATLAKLFK
jgi:peptidoglycan hydrolase-like protein with peptidoglycan-binding domain